MAIKVYFHGADLDGHCSGAIVKYKFPECELYPINYGQEFPFDEINQDDEVYMVDFCLQPDSEMLRLERFLRDEGELYWIDHHSGNSQLRYKMTDWQGCFNVDKAACELTWEYLFPGRPVPLAVKLLSLYDSWTYQGHELEDMVLPFQMRLRMEELDPRNWEECAWRWRELFRVNLDETYTNAMIHDSVEEGRLLLSYDEQQKKSYCRTYAFETELKYLGNEIEETPLEHGFVAKLQKCKTLKAIAVNLGHTNSKVFDSVWRKECPGKVADDHDQSNCPFCSNTGYIEPYDLMITFCRRKDKIWNISLYSTKPDIDCGAIAKSFNGGGHKGAAGFSCNTLPFEY